MSETKGEYKTTPLEDRHPNCISNHPLSFITKREYFAAKAMQGYSASKRYSGETHKIVADMSVIRADALIEALDK